MSVHTVARFMSGLPLAIGPRGGFLGRWMKSTEWAWGADHPGRMSLIKSATIESWVCSNCPNNRQSSKSWNGTAATFRWMTARRLTMVAWGGGPSGAQVHPVMARTWAGESASSRAKCV